VSDSTGGFLSRLRRDLGSVESYAAMVGMLVGAGIFKVTGVGSELTGSGVILAYLILAPIVFATSVPYMVFVSTPLGLQPGGEYSNLEHTFGGRRLAFLAAWLKCIAYLGALAYLAQALADYGLQLLAPSLGEQATATWGTVVALLALGFFFFVHVSGVRWFGRLQVGMCALLGVSIAVLVVPGLFVIEVANYRPLLPHGATGLARALAPLFFAYAGFEALAHTAGEVRDSRRRLPGIFLRGIAATTVIFVLMSVVSFGVLPVDTLTASEAPMATAAAAYLPTGAAAVVTLGGILAVATSLNATMLVPARIWLLLARDGLLPGWMGIVHVDRGTPVPGLAVSFVVAAVLLVSGQMSLALNIAVFALVAVYGLHSLALLLLPARNPELYRQVTVGLSPACQRGAALCSLVGMGTLIVVLVIQDVGHIAATSLGQRLSEQSLTSLELFVLWGGLGLLIYQVRVRQSAA